jgi:DNA-binding transcriptional LysR family regulator
MGLLLFERTDTGFKATAAGKEVIRTEAQIAAILSELEERAVEMKGGKAGHVTFGIVSTAKYFAPFLMRAFQDIYPQIKLTLRVGNRQEILSQLEDFTLDMALIGRPPQEISVEMAEVGQQPHVVIASPEHKLARRRHVVASSLSDQTFIIREQGSGTRLLTERIMSELGVAPKTGMEISSNETIKQAVMAGLGISMLSYHTVSHEVMDGRLAILRVEGTPVIRKWYLVRNKEKRFLPAARSLWTFVEKSGRDFLPVLNT